MALERLSGKIKNYTRTRKHADFVFDDSDKTKIGVVAIAAGLAGLSGQAISLASADTNEAADYIEFELDGKPVKGWVWRSPFREDDAVEIVAEWQNDHYEAYAVARPEDRIVALYPHCSRGVKRHVKNAWKWWFWGTSISVFIIMVMLMGIGYSADGNLHSFMSKFFFFLSWLSLGFFSFFGLMTYSLTRKWMPFVRLAERVFTAFGWDNPGEIDLVKRSKETHDQPYFAPHLELGLFDGAEDVKTEDPDPNLPNFLRPTTEAQRIEELRHRAQTLPEPARTEELQRIESIVQHLAQSDREFKENDLLKRTSMRNSLINAYGSMYFRY